MYNQDKEGYYVKEYLYASFPNAECLDLKDQFIWLMSQEDETCLKEIAKFVSHCMELGTRNQTNYYVYQLFSVDRRYCLTE